jgi:hypothetical protein
MISPLMNQIFPTTAGIENGMPLSWTNGKPLFDGDR